MPLGCVCPLWVLQPQFALGAHVLSGTRAEAPRYGERLIHLNLKINERYRMLAFH